MRYLNLLFPFRDSISAADLARERHEKARKVIEMMKVKHSILENLEGIESDDADRLIANAVNHRQEALLVGVVGQYARRWLEKQGRVGIAGIETVKSTQRRHEQRVRELEGRIQELEGETTELSTKNTKLERRIQELQGETTELSTKNAELITASGRKDENLKEMEDKLKNVEEETTEMEDMLEQTERYRYQAYTIGKTLRTRLDLAEDTLTRTTNALQTITGGDRSDA